MNAERLRPQTEAIPPTPEDEFERWLDDVYPILKETWLAGYQAHQNSNGQTPSLTPSISESSSLSPNRRSAQDWQERQEGEPLGNLWEMPNHELPPNWRKVYHLRGERPCRQAAFIVTRAVVFGETADITDVLRKVNGQKVSPDDIPECGFCGLELDQPSSNRDLDWEPHLVHRSVNVRFADNPDNPEIREHPIDTANRLLETVNDPYTEREERLDGPQRLVLEDEEEALRELGRTLEVYTQDVGYSPEEDNADLFPVESSQRSSGPVSGRENAESDQRRTETPGRSNETAASGVSLPNRSPKTRKRSKSQRHRR